jgi:NSS family neurotransmitter:Na+ symporter
MKARSERGSWSGALGFVLASMGSAVGLGNVWRFPYIAGLYGGAAFILVYIGCVLAVGIPILLAEFLIGRNSQRNPVGAFRFFRPRSPWVFPGWLGVLSGFVILSYYSVVGGWVLHYVYLSVTGALSGRSPQEAAGLFAALGANVWLQVLWHAIFMLLTIAIVAGGISGGIEVGNKVMMPALFCLLLALLVYALQTEGARAGLDFLLRPRWERLGPTAVLDALGQCLFSLSLGMGAMITYGSYLPREAPLVRSSFFVALGDTTVAILAGFVVFPLVFTFGLEPSAGPSLIFRTLPVTFGQLPAGGLVASAFFLLLAFAALTSAISLLEVVSSYFIDERGWSRRRAAWLLGGAIFGLGLPSALNQSFLGLMDGLATNYLLPIGALLIALFTGWVLRDSELRGGFAAGELSEAAYSAWSFLVRFVSPLAVILIFLHQVGLF